MTLRVGALLHGEGDERLSRIIYAAIMVALTLSSAAHGAQQQATTQGSFLGYRANSAAELAAMVKRDPKLAARYANHFGTTSGHLATYFRNRLTLIRLKQSQTAVMYYFGPDGKVVRSKRVMPAGTLVFATRSGTPVLDWRCGNPMTNALPEEKPVEKYKPAVTMEKPAPEPKVAVAPSVTETVVEKVLEQPPAELVTVAALPPTALSTPPPAPTLSAVLPPVLEAAAAPAVTAVGAVPAVALSSGGLGWLLPLAAVGAVGAIGGAGGREDNPPPPPPVPEPNVIAPLSAGILATCAAVGRTRRRYRLR